MMSRLFALLSGMKPVRRLLSVPILLAALSGFAWAQERPAYWTGNGGKGTRITVSELSGNGLSADERRLPPLVQGTVIAAFQRFSAMTVFDMLNLENIIRVQDLSLTGDFSDKDAIRIGHLTNANLVVFGSITKTITGYTIDLAVTNAETGVRRASYGPRQVSLFALENLSAIREASADLLGQLGVNLTADGRQELAKTEASASLQAENLLARGIAAQRQGTVVDALTYFFEAASLNPSLGAAFNRISTVSANVATGNLGRDTRNRIREHDEWRTIVNTASYFYSSHLPYEFVYGTNVKQGEIDFAERTVDLSIDISLIPTETAWATINDLRKGLNAARGNDAWAFNLDSIEPRRIAVTMEVLNDKGVVLSTATHSFGNPSETDRTNATLTFRNVEAAGITDRLTVRVAGVNEIPARMAGETGFMRISTARERAQAMGYYDENDQLRAELRAERKAAMREEIMKSAKRNSAWGLSPFLFWKGGEDPLSGWGITVGGASFSPVPYFSLGFEALKLGFSDGIDGWDGVTYLSWLSLKAGPVLPLGRGARIFGNGIIEFTSPPSLWLSNGDDFEKWRKISEYDFFEGVNPGLEVGMEFGWTKGYVVSVWYGLTSFGGNNIHSVGINLFGGRW